jgi:hypothetical protein
VAQARQYSAVIAGEESKMFKKILIANRGGQPRSGAAAQLNCLAREFSPEVNHV